MGKNNKPKQQPAVDMFADGGIATEDLPVVKAVTPGTEAPEIIELGTEPSAELRQAQEKLVDDIIEKIPTATPVEPENVPVGGEPKTIQEAPTEPKKDSEQELIDELTSILRVPKSKDALMTFSMFSDKYQKRYFLLDVDGTAYRRAWEVFKERTGSKDQNRFLFLVYTILEMNPPRLHRGVDWVPLE